MNINKLYKSSELITADPENLKDFRKKLGKLAGAIGTLRTRTMHPADKNELQEQDDALRKYIGRVDKLIGTEEMIVGEGIKSPFGNYLIDKKKLKKNILSLSYPNCKKVNGFPNIKISDDLKKMLINNKINKNYDLSEDEKEYLRKLIDKSEAQVSKSKENALCNKTWDRLHVLLGELRAGYTSRKVKEKLAEIAHHFYKNDELSKPDYQKFLSKLI